jgi:hypothetical protein
MDKWDKISIVEFLELIGQEGIKIKNDLDGTSFGDWGQVKFFTIAEDAELRLVFECADDANRAWNAFTSTVSNPYAFARRDDMMPTVIMVTLEV